MLSESNNSKNFKTDAIQVKLPQIPTLYHLNSSVVKGRSRSDYPHPVFPVIDDSFLVIIERTL